LYERSPLFDEKDKAVLLYTERMTRAARRTRDVYRQAIAPSRRPSP